MSGYGCNCGCRWNCTAVALVVSLILGIVAAFLQVTAVIAYDDLIACGSMAAAKEKGLVRSEGKEYVMKDGDVVLFRFNV